MVKIRKFDELPEEYADKLKLYVTKILKFLPRENLAQYNFSLNVLCISLYEWICDYENPKELLENVNKVILEMLNDHINEK